MISGQVTSLIKVLSLQVQSRVRLVGDLTPYMNLLKSRQKQEVALSAPIREADRVIKYMYNVYNMRCIYPAYFLPCTGFSGNLSLKHNSIHSHNDEITLGNSIFGTIWENIDWYVHTETLIVAHGKGYNLGNGVVCCKIMMYSIILTAI